MEKEEIYRSTIHNIMLQDYLRQQIQDSFYDQSKSNQITYYLLHHPEKKNQIDQAERLIASIQRNLAHGNLKHAFYMEMALKHLIDSIFDNIAPLQIKRKKKRKRKGKAK
ncbi:hypothetical protein [Neobacillus sp. SAB-20_R2A]|uniref:hypothetical protein n=1 Tax=Neobacillus sp. SAB-20_R2A TaxID=3120519 RepID=UPI003C6E3853